MHVYVYVSIYGMLSITIILFEQIWVPVIEQLIHNRRFRKEQ